ncbi:hypothetical protein NG798_08090 [Ancylothrix sp. C2]|uniref:hypothetical protein n=1 Tax=Ancylothrix sp. D3o TaxID=2953691 RepID=UPI0021BB4667|nr:hypothetical protein [Ancylothrix sp. D3o]MCT7949745.1 hypothetical protein [Ancylothrix sp. D3o]
MNYAELLMIKTVRLVTILSGSLLFGVLGSSLAGVAEEPMNSQPMRQQTEPGASLPLPEQQQGAMLRVMPVDGQLIVKLINQTGDPITYQVVEDTKPRFLSADGEVRLTDLKAPLTLTFHRPNGGLISVSSQPSSEAGVLEVMLNQTSNLSADKNALVVETNGLVFVY